MFAQNVRGENNEYEPPDREPPSDPDEVPFVRSSEGVVASSNATATQVGVEVLENGGDAVDAAAAVQLALAVVEPNGTGLGGGGYMSIYRADEGRLYGINKTVRAMAGATPEMPTDYDTGLAAGIPGIIRGLDYTLKRWGNSYFDEVAQPAIDLAEEGWEVDLELHRRIHQTQDNLNEQARDVYLDDEGNPLEPGDLLVQPDKAWTLTQIAEGGSEAFYQGAVAERVVEHLRELGANYKLDDYARYNVTVDHPVWTEFDGHDIAVFPEYNGIGIAETVEMWDRLPADRLEPGSAEQLHYHIQAVRTGYDDYLEFATDPEYVDMPHGGLWSEEYLDDRFDEGVDVEAATDPGPGDPWAYQSGEPYRTRGHDEAFPRDPLIDGASTAGSQSSVSSGREYLEPQNPNAPHAGQEEPAVTTNHYAVADADGNLVMSTTTLGVGWVAGIMPEGTGFMLSVLQSYFGGAGSVDEPRPHKRPGIPMCHLLAFEDDEPVLALGTPQGPPAIYSAVPHMMVNVLAHDMDLAEATAEPRIARGGFPGVEYEPTLDDDVVEALEDRGNSVYSGVLGCMQSIRKHRRGRSGRWEWTAAADPRREGDAGAVDDGRGPPGRGN